MKKILFILALILCCSCATERHLARVGHSFTFSEGCYTPIKEYRIVQVIDKNFCIAAKFQKGGPKAIAVSISDKEGPIAKEQVLEGLYVMIDTYTYKNVNGDTVTVPLVTSIRDFEDMQYTEKILAKREKLENKIKKLQNYNSEAISK